MDKKTEKRIVDTAEFFTPTQDGTGLGFAHQAILYTDGDNLYLAETDSQLDEKEINVNSLSGKLILPETVYPPFDADRMTKASLPSKDFYIKRPNLLSHTIWGENSSHLKELILGEVLICEELLRSPHPNIQTYYGCQIENGYVTSLCFKRYVDTLQERVEGHEKCVRTEQIMEGIRSAVLHMHKLGYCHNDIHPDNIMFDEHDVAVIIDFDSSKKIGHELGVKVGNRGFFPDGAVLSVPTNDFYALEMLEGYLSQNYRLDQPSVEKASNGKQN